VTSTLKHPVAAPDRGRDVPTSTRVRDSLRTLPLLPAVLMLLVFFLGPVIYAVYGSLTNASLTGLGAVHPRFVGGANYASLLTDPDFPRVVWLTVVFVVASAIIGQNILGMVLALLMNAASPTIAGLARTVIVLTWILPEIVAAFVLYAFYNKTGTLAQVLSVLGVHNLNLLFTAPLIPIILANVWRGTAFSMMNYQAALSGVPPELNESAMIDGAGGWRRFFEVTLPIVRGSVVTNLMLITLQTLSVFTLIWVMTAGGPSGASTTLPVFAFTQAFKSGNIGYGTAIATIILLIGAVFAVFYVRVLPKGDRR
jgi:multiple sugar transport system permease protein